ncbi:arp2/3 complex-activating protein rickA [Austrofundulus limnaeus]|uniref:Arp2/3 complex-activating protein rickA n=1 Tax=Austrofundulus limnaeus TaxID=52670 RepID=A0A2I4BZQ5_AUSLI|nr:PREDICTED: arp2/3 complex-activating protein rickA-like [Austrofundulus limnaeus]
MEGQVQKRQLPKRDRVPPKKIKCYQPHPQSPKEDLNGLFVFLTFEDGYTAKTFKVCDILSKDEKKIDTFEDLKPGDEVLARWSDNKFYCATVEYVGNDDNKKVAKKDSVKVSAKKKDPAAKKFFSHSLFTQSEPEDRPPSQQPSSPWQPPHSHAVHQPLFLHQLYSPPPPQPSSHHQSSQEPPPPQPSTHHHSSQEPPPLQPSTHHHSSQQPPPPQPSTHHHSSQQPPPLQPSTHHHSSQQPPPLQPSTHHHSSQQPPPPQPSTHHHSSQQPPPPQPSTHHHSSQLEHYQNEISP